MLGVVVVVDVVVEVVDGIGVASASAGALVEVVAAEVGSLFRQAVATIAVVRAMVMRTVRDVINPAGRGSARTATALEESGPAGLRWSGNGFSPSNPAIRPHTARAGHRIGTGTR